MTESGTNSPFNSGFMDLSLQELLSLRASFRKRLEFIEQNREKISDYVYGKLRQEYSSWLAAIEGEVSFGLADYEIKLSEVRLFSNQLELLEKSYRERLEELSLRHALGEFDSEHYKKLSGRHESRMKRFAESISAYREQEQRLVEFLEKVDRGGRPEPPEKAVQAEMGREPVPEAEKAAGPAASDTESPGSVDRPSAGLLDISGEPPESEEEREILEREFAMPLREEGPRSDEAEEASAAPEPEPGAAIQESAGEPEIEPEEPEAAEEPADEPPEESEEFEPDEPAPGEEPAAVQESAEIEESVEEEPEEEPAQDRQSGPEQDEVPVMEDIMAAAPDTGREEQGSGAEEEDTSSLPGMVEQQGEQAAGPEQEQEKEAAFDLDDIFAGAAPAEPQSPHGEAVEDDSLERQLTEETAREEDEPAEAEEHSGDEAAAKAGDTALDEDDLPNGTGAEAGGSGQAGEPSGSNGLDLEAILMEASGAQPAGREQKPPEPERQAEQQSPGVDQDTEELIEREALAQPEETGDQETVPEPEPEKEPAAEAAPEPERDSAQEAEPERAVEPGPTAAPEHAEPEAGAEEEPPEPVDYHEEETRQRPERETPAVAAEAQASLEPSQPPEALDIDGPVELDFDLGGEDSEDGISVDQTIDALKKKTVKCRECGAMNYAIRWYCENCEATLTTL